VEFENFLLNLFSKGLKALISIKTKIMSADKDRSSPAPTNHDKTEQGVNQSTETRTKNSSSKLWLVILIIIVFLLIILSYTGVVNF
jgi:hypothetical protein